MKIKIEQCRLNFYRCVNLVLVILKSKRLIILGPSTNEQQEQMSNWSLPKYQRVAKANVRLEFAPYAPVPVIRKRKRPIGDYRLPNCSLHFPNLLESKALN